MTATMTFEKALAELEQIVAKLEKEGTSLNDSLALFEKGVKLARFLRTELDKAERKVEILLKDEKGGLKAEAFDAGEEEEAGEEEDERGKAASGRKKGGDDVPF
jgi:exodeoxyribonuclease VII small subunit